MGAGGQAGGWAGTEGRVTSQRGLQGGATGPQRIRGARGVSEATGTGRSRHKGHLVWGVVRTVALEGVGSGGGYGGANNLTGPCMGGLEELDFILRAQVGGGHQRF